MMLNAVLLFIGMISILYGFKNKLKLWIIVGVILIVSGVVSEIVDYKFSDTKNGIDGGRVPMVIDNTMR